MYQFKTKDSNVKPYSFYLSNLSKNITADSMKETGLNWYVYKFSVGYNTTDVSGIANIHKYLMKNIKYCLSLLNKVLLCY